MKYKDKYDGLGFTYLLNIDANAKTVKGQLKGYMTAILYLAPHTIASRIDVCPFSTKGCRASCLYTAGHGVYGVVKKARKARTTMMVHHRPQFMKMLDYEISAFEDKAKRAGLIPVVRLNGTSDIDWNFYYQFHGINWTIFDKYSNIQFYDYTKDLAKVFRNKLANYHLTFSASEKTTRDTVQRLFVEGYNVATVFDKDSYKVAVDHGALDGDANDLRFLDDKGKVVALSAKGMAKKDKTGFVTRGLVMK